MNQIAVVHIPSVALNLKLLFNKVVESIRKHKRSRLRDLTSQAVADGPEVVKAFVRQRPRPLVVDSSLKLHAHRPMLGLGEVVGEVEEKDVALVAVLAVMPLQVAGKPVERERDSLVLRARAVVVDERGLEARVDGLIA